MANTTDSNKRTNKIPRLTVFSSLILLLVVLTTNPQSLPSVVLVVPFVLLFFILVSVASYLLQSLGVARPRSLKVGIAAGAVPALLLVLQSLGQLTIRDTFVIIALFAVVQFYLARFSARIASP